MKRIQAEGGLCCSAHLCAWKRKRLDRGQSFRPPFSTFLGTELTPSKRTSYHLPIALRMSQQHGAEELRGPSTFELLALPTSQVRTGRNVKLYFIDEGAQKESGLPKVTRLCQPWQPGPWPKGPALH